MFKVRPKDNVVLESCHGCFQIPMRMGEKRRCARKNRLAPQGGFWYSSTCPAD
jgi:hypothetical protein